MWPKTSKEKLHRTAMQSSKTTLSCLSLSVCSDSDEKGWGNDMRRCPDTKRPKKMSANNIRKLGSVDPNMKRPNQLKQSTCMRASRFKPYHAIARPEI
jgi:hypothetical protein